MLTRRVSWALRLTYFLLISNFVSLSAYGEKVLRWQPDPEFNQVRHGAQQMWNEMLWGVDFLTGRTWAFDGTKYIDGGKMPGDNRPMIGLYTDYGAFLLGPAGSGETTKSEIVYSPDGFQNYTTVLSVESYSSDKPFAAALRRSLADLGDGRLMYFQYSDNTRIFYSDNQGQDWQEILTPLPGSIRHLHGGFYDADYGKLYLMAGDGDSQASIMVCDDLFGTDGLINNPNLWLTRWGMTDKLRTTLDPAYFLAVNGVIRSQRVRTVDMEIDGNFLIWGEDSGFTGGQSIYRTDRQTGETTLIGDERMIGGPWRMLATTDGDFLTYNSSIHFQSALLPGMDEFAHIYKLNEDRTDYVEAARFLSRATTGTGTTSYGFTDAFDRLWLNGYNITQKNLDLVGRLVEVTLGDVNGDDLVTVEDIDLLTSHILGNGSLPVFDMDLSGYVDQVDRELWVEQIVGTSFGDANLDGRFDSQDLVLVMQAGQYEADASQNTGWAAGDWNGDHRFTSADLVLAFDRGLYYVDNDGRQPRVVPEPSTGVLSAILLVGLLGLRRR
ncbi:MAG: dockerin type I repeat-containing protein [Planctomycetales bacterium]|nr:dockerin type I repeat-containing protein [Planctomycetales bacterium]